MFCIWYLILRFTTVPYCVLNSVRILERYEASVNNEYPIYTKPFYAYIIYMIVPHFVWYLILKFSGTVLCFRFGLVFRSKQSLSGIWKEKRLVFQRLTTILFRSKLFYFFFDSPLWIAFGMRQSLHSDFRMCLKG